MAKNVDHVQHIKSNMVVEIDGVKSPKLPNPSALTEGEIAINYAKYYETISLKNESGDVVTFSSDNYYTEKKLGSGFTGENSANTVTSVVGSGFTSSSITDVIIENEEIVSAALADLDERKLDASAYTPTDLSNYYTKSETSGATEISNALGAKVNSATYTGHTADTTVHFTTGAVQTQIDNSISGKVNTSDIVTAITPSNSGSTEPIATKVVAENELTVSNALTDLSTNKADKSTTYTKSEIDDMIGDIETLLAAI